MYWWLGRFLVVGRMLVSMVFGVVYCLESRARHSYGARPMDNVVRFLNVSYHGPLGMYRWIISSAKFRVPGLSM